MKQLWKGILLFFLIWSTVLSGASAQSNKALAVQVVLFYSPSCSHCHYVIGELLLPMTEEYGEQLQIVAIDVTQPDGQQLYQTAIAHYQIPTNRQGVPTLIIGDVVLVGSGEIPERFPALVEQHLAAGGISWPNIPHLHTAISALAEDIPAPTPTLQRTATPDEPGALVAAKVAETVQEPVYLAYFFDPTCLECAQVSHELDQLKLAYPKLIVQEFNINDEAALNEALCEKYNVPDDQRLLAPMIFIGEECLVADEITPVRLQPLIEDPATAQMPPPWEGLEPAESAARERIVDRFEQFSLLAVAGAGLLDGVNPCAFTTIIFFVSYLTLVGRKGKEILLVGSAFTLAVFLTYLLLGLGLAEVMHQIGPFTLISQGIYGVTALICLTLAALSLWDYIKIRQGKLTEIALQLPKSLKRRIHQTIRTRSRIKGFVWAAFTAGVLVSIFELACTGQVYLPTIIFVSGVAEMRLTALLFLLLYNLMFVVPLVVVFLVTYWGTSSQGLTAIFQTNAGRVKLLTAFLFAVLGVWLGYMVLIGI